MTKDEKKQVFLEFNLFSEILIEIKSRFLAQYKMTVFQPFFTLIVEDFERIARGYFTDCAHVKAMWVITITRLDEYCTVGETLGKDLTTRVVQMNTFANVTSRILNCWISIHIW